MIPAYNGEQFIRDAVLSALQQMNVKIEVIVVDDGSTDRTLAVVDAVNDPRLKVVRQKNGGVASARNTGIRLASGSYIALLDQDDIWFDHKLETQLELFSDENVGAVGSFMQYLGRSGPIKARAGEIADHQRQRIRLGRLMPFPPSSLVLRTDLLQEIGGFNERLVTTVGPIDDLELLSRVATRATVKTAPSTLGFYRIHENAGSFKSFSDMHVGTKFLQESIAEFGEVRISHWDSWRTKNTPSWADLRRQRARFEYRSSGLAAADGSRPEAVRRLALAFMLDPRYTVPRLARQLGSR
ncbi:glycosyltransferase [Rhodococcus corynebacterioides]|nr:glycosyltransferase [Rhodococcus corynebacterioides]